MDRSDDRLPESDVYQGQRHTGERTHFVGDDCPREEVVPTEADSSLQLRTIRHGMHASESATPAPAAAMTGDGGGDSHADCNQRNGPICTDSRHDADALRAAVRRVDEACPCHKYDAQVVCAFSCRCWLGGRIDPARTACLWPGHTAARDLARKAAEWADCQDMTPADLMKTLDALLDGRDDDRA